MRPPAADRVRTQPPRRGWRAVVVRLLALVVAVSFFVPLAASQVAAASASKLSSVVSLDEAGGKPLGAPLDYGLVAHSVHCVGHSVVHTGTVVAELVRTADKVQYPAGDSLGSPLRQNPPERPPRA